MKKKILAIAAFAVAVTTQASLTWTGAGDGISLFLEANWLDDNDLVPAANTINSGTAVTAATGGLILIDSGTGSPNAVGAAFDIGVGNDLQIGGGKVLNLNSFGLRVDGPAGVSNSTVTVLGGSTLYAQFFLDIDVVLDGASIVTLNGGGNPLNGSTINILDTDSVIQFKDETYAAFSAEHGNKVTLYGAVLNFGADAFVIEAGDTAVASAFNGTYGVQIQIIPEPATLGILASIRH